VAARRERRARQAVCLCAALGVHAIVLGLVLARQLPREPTPQPTLELSIAIDEGPEPAPSSVADAPRTSETFRALPDARRGVAGERARAAGRPAPTSPEGASTGDLEASGPAPGAEWSPSWTAPPHIDLGLDGGLMWQAVLQADRRADPTTTDTDPGKLRDALDEGDRALGLGGGGTVVRAVHDAALAVAAIRDGSASIEVTTDAAGRVLAVHAFDVTSDEATWNEVARAIAGALLGRNVRVPPGARGVAVTVRVEVAVRTASGASSGRPVAPVANSDGVGLGFDVSDMGSRPRSVVHARVLGERRL